MIVMKFGGSSLRSSRAIGEAIAIIRGRMPQQPLVIVSALGKATDNLLALGRDASAGQQQWRSKIADLKNYHLEVADEVLGDTYGKHASEFVNSHFRELQGLTESLQESRSFTPQAQDAVTSFGERLSSGIVAMSLQASGIASAHLDSRALIRTDNRHTHATPLLRETYANIRNAVQRAPESAVPVMGGFIASSTDGATTTLGRNSSNLTAMLAAAAMNAELVELWTDVDGVFRHDPRNVPDQYPMDEMNFVEALALAQKGAKVLHAEAVMLAWKENIPIHIKNSSRPKLPGTRISSATGQSRTVNAESYLGAASSD
jgi:aspartate kinase